MEDKQVSTVSKITGSLIGEFFLYGILFGILYSFIYSAITNILSEGSLILTAIISIILQGITVFCIWRCSIASTFKKRLISTNDVKTVMRNLMIFTIILCIITAIINFVQVDKELEKAINSNIGLTMSETYMSYLYTDQEIAQYEAEKEKAISEAKTKSYTYLAVLEVGLLAVYIGAIPLQKKAILKYAV